MKFNMTQVVVLVIAVVTGLQSAVTSAGPIIPDSVEKPLLVVLAGIASIGDKLVKKDDGSGSTGTGGA